MQTSIDAANLTWYTLLDPTTDQFFYACPATGACSWLPPTSGSILQGHLPDWWEMYDEGTKRPYYFNNATQETLWVLPKDLNVIPVPLSSEDDAKLRNVLGPPPTIENEPDFTTEEIEEGVDEVLEEPVNDTDPEVIDVKAVTAASIASKSPSTSPRKLVENTTAEWVALEDPRTGYAYFMNRKTLKLAWNHTEMLHQQIAEHESAKAAPAPLPAIEAPKPVAFVVKHDPDPDFTTDTWRPPTEPPPIPVKQNNTPSSSAAPTKPKMAPPVAPSSQKIPNSIPRKESHSESELPHFNESIPTAPLYVPKKAQYRASIMQRPLPSPINIYSAPKKGPPSSVSAMLPVVQKHTPGALKSNSAANLHAPAAAKVPATATKGRSHTGSSVSKEAPLPTPIPVAPAAEPKRGRSRSFDGLEQGEGAMQPVAGGTGPTQNPKVNPTMPKIPPAVPPMPARIVNSASSPKLETAPAVPKFPIPSEAGHRSAPRPTPHGATAPSAKGARHPSPVSNAPPALPASPPGSFQMRSQTPTPPGSTRNLATQPRPKPFNGAPPPIPTSVIPGSAKLPYPSGAPNHSGKSVIVTMDNRSRTGSRNRISFRASISRVAPPTQSELQQEAAAYGLNSSAHSPPGVKLPFMRSMAPNPHQSPAVSLGNLFAPPKVAAARPPTSIAPSASVNNMPTSSAPRSLPANRLEVSSGSATTSRASTRPNQRPVLRKSYTLSNARPSVSGGAPAISSDLKAQINFFQLEGFAQQYFKNMKKGLFRRAVPVRQRLTWTQAGLKQPLLKLKGEHAKKSLAIFKNIQIFMGDRAIGTSHEEKLKLIEHVFEVGLNTAQLRDEIFCQLCKQTTLNPNADSTTKGWSLITLMLQYFSPTKDLEHWFTDYCREHEKSNNTSILPYVKYALKILSVPVQSGSTLRIPEPDEIDLALKSPLQPRLFGVSLNAVLENQKKHKTPTLNEPGIPFIMTNLIAIVTRLRGLQTEGIFRIPGSHKLCTMLRLQLEAGNYSGEGILDPHVPASVLKWWLRDLEEPVIPALFYSSCLDAAKSANPETACPAVIERLPALNKSIVYSIIKFVQILAKPENQAETKMAVGSLAIVFGPNLLRCQATEMTSVFEAQKWEQTFVVNLVKHLKT